MYIWGGPPLLAVSVGKPLASASSLLGCAVTRGSWTPVPHPEFPPSSLDSFSQTVPLDEFYTWLGWKISVPPDGAMSYISLSKRISVEAL